MEKLSVQFLAPHLWRWIVLCLPALALAFWSYYRILAPVSRPARWVLWCLRGAAFLLVLLALWQPVLTAVLAQTGRPGIAVLVDRSASMGLPAGGTPGVSREEQARRIAHDLSAELKDRFRLQWYGFSDGIHPVQPDSGAVPAGNTGLGHALEEVLNQSNSSPVGGILVLSDGVNTVGRDPVRVAGTSPVPVFTLAIGPAEPTTDVEIHRVRTNPTAFSGEPLPVQVVLSSWGLGGRNVRLEVSDKESVLGAKDVTLLGDGGLEQEVTIEVRPRQPGLALLDVTAKGVNDSIPQNDHRQVAVRVLERKTRVLVMAGQPDWDFAFLRRILGRDTTLAYSFLAQVRPGEYETYGEKRVSRPPNGAAELRDFAAVVLSGFDRVPLPPATAEALAGYVRQGGGLFLIGPPPAGGSAALNAILPGTVGADPRGDQRMAPVTVTLDGERHPATAVRDNPAETSQLWSSLPPLWRAGDMQPKPQAKRLLDYRIARGEGPAALAVSFEERGKVAWLDGQGIWRWGFLPAGGPAPQDVYPQFLLGLTRWLAEPAIRERFQVAPGNLVYQNGEPVSFTASLWDASYAPVSGAQIAVEVRSAADSSAALQSIDLQAGSDPGNYDGEGAPLPPGPYIYRAVAREAGSSRELEHTHGRFWVETMGPEFARTWTDREQLEQIARRSGGASADAGSYESILGQIPRAVHRQGRIREFEVWNHWLLFCSFVAVLSAEWFLRRRRGMA